MTTEAISRLQYDDDEPDYTRILDNIAASQNIDKLMTFVANAQKKNVVVVRDAALSRLKDLLPVCTKDSFEQAFWDMFSAYQSVLIENEKSTVKLVQARRTAITDSEEGVLADWVETGAQKWAFEYLMSENKSDLTAEGLVLKFPGKFPADLKKLAKARMEVV